LFTDFPAKATTVLMAMAGAVMAVGVVFLVVFSSEHRLDRLDAAEQQKVSAVYDEMVAAAEALKVDALFNHVADNDQGALITNGQLFLTRTAALERTRENFRGVAQLKYHIAERRVTFLAPDAAVLVATGTSAVELEDGRRFSNAFAHTVVFVKRQGVWRVIHSHQSSPVAR
jgi:uncharacterized protein (TIGR02246 family)